MQLSARILTALAVLAFTVAVVAGRGATEEVSAATGTIDALNVGACTTTNDDVLDISDCRGFDAEGNVDADGAGNTNALFEAEELDEAIVVDELYATYAHDPKTAAEAPRGIIANGDLIKISIKDTGRDRRDPVLIAIDNAGVGEAAVVRSRLDSDTDETNDPEVFKPTVDTTSPTDRIPDTLPWVLDDDYDDNAETPGGGSLEVVADSVGVASDALKDLELQVPHFGINNTADANFTASGSYTVRWQGSDADNPFPPIAPDGKVRFFGRIHDGLATGGDGIDGWGPFKDIGGNVKLDEDVISGEDGTPAMILNVSVPTAVTPSLGGVHLQVIYYETSDTENLDGGQCYKETTTDDVTTCSSSGDANDAPDDVIFTKAERDDNTALLVQATSDGNDGAADLYLTETGIFDGVYQGFLRLTDADGDGAAGEGSDNWGEDIDGDGNATDATVGNAATLGVGNGPVVINYRDSDGQTRSFTIQIDIDPPVINVDSPVHNSRSDDEKPSFVGTINDGDAGLAADTFQLYVDNDPRRGNTTTVLSGLDADYVMGIDVGIDRRLEYTGYDADPPKYGVIPSDTWMDESTLTPRAYKSVEADAYSNGAPDGEFADEIEIDFDEIAGYTFPDGAFNHKIEFQALVRDLAGNVGFSDSDPAKPRFINDLGEKLAERTKPNVLGVFSKHAVWLDEVDPYILDDRTATGFYGLDDGAPIRDRSAVMVVFDNAVDGSLIDSGTFTLEDADGNGVAIADVMVKDQLVFLKLDEELASDARPTLSISDGREVEDLAGNILSSAEHILAANGERVNSFKVKDGILPVFTLTLSGGSGIGTGGESSSMLTKEAIDIAIESDEDINGAPKVSVVCSNIKFNEADGSSLAKDDNEDVIVYDLGRFEANRMGYDADTDLEMNRGCGATADPAKSFIESSSLSRPGNNWVYAWRNPTGAASELPDGGLTVVVWARDRGGFDYYKDKPDSPAGTPDPRLNFGSETVAFTLDTTFNSPLSTAGGDVQPDPDTDVAEPRPFVLLDFAGERTNVKVTKMSVDGTDVLGSLDNIGENRFLYWPEALDYGEHTVEFDARDAADNKPSGGTKFSFNVTQRDPFVLDISAGWNAISFPANPVDTALDAVFTDPAIDRVVGWNPMNSNGAWSIASRVDGVWTTSMDFAPLTDVVIRYGYWVHSMAFIKQSVDLEGPINRETGGKPNPIGIQTVPGWNFIGVVDQDGDQTEDNFGDTLQDSEDADVSADDYMPGFKRAYTWDAIANGYRVLEGDGDMIIGKGIWVFFPDGTTVAP
ncbi:MAG: hypothetical protein F4Y88_04260 [Chloroflexi bacterium]|nr:hypothetical protein [Chloroflexota bacterium]